MKMVMVSFYVDDLIIFGNDEQMIIEFRISMKNEFDMTDLGRMRYFLGSISPGFKLSKGEDGVKVDKTYYKQVVGSLMYLNATRPNMMFVVSLASRYMVNPTKQHLQVVKRALRYLKGTTKFGIFYKKGGEDELVAYTDSNYAGDIENRMSTYTYVFLLSSRVISWSSKKQPVVSLSTTKAEFIGATLCACQAVWLQRVLAKLDKNHEKLITIFYLAKTDSIKLVHCNSQDQLADVITKPLKLD
ncbi:Retrovirus-related Pol polyprotein from transposon TNT 1-94 [Gossypium australe]|uniref:Retrovirus-related Pol polyprotein from transposon TNT 1-94 n=1 Tax=Gossypium australe TaxID=47621 RepID=A0A5B6V7Q8_9ROSI|nr:Retrovirus-related Pol polyprotein from transposon TNT 1-94 [Gossypium australe]